MKKKFKNSNHNEELKMQQLKLKHEKEKTTSSSSKSQKQSQSINNIAKGSKGFTVNNKSIVVNTLYEESDRFNRSLKSDSNPKGRIADNKDIGKRVQTVIKYQDREAEQEHENELKLDESIDKNMSHSYDLEKRLSKEDIKNINQEVENGVPALRTTVISIGQDSKLSKEEDLKIVQQAISEHNAKYNKNVNTVITQHNDSKNRHHHVLQYGTKDNIDMSPTQLESLKLRVATLTKDKLDEKDLSHKLDKEINLILDKQEKLLRIEEKLDKHVENIQELNQNRLNEISKETEKIVNNLELSKDQLEAIKAFEKANGYRESLEKQKNPDPEKLQKAEKWRDDVSKKMDATTKDKHTQLRVEIDKFNNSKEFEAINNKFKEEAKEATLNVSKELKDMSKEYKPSFFRAGDKQLSNIVEKNSKKMEYQAANIDKKKFKKVSMDSVLNKAAATDKETKDEAIKELVKDIKTISKDITKEDNASYNKEKGGSFLEHDKVSKSDANEINLTLKGLDNEKRISKKEMDEVAKSQDMKDKLESSQAERFKHSKNQQSSEFRNAQTKFFNSQAVMRDGVDLKSVGNYVDYAISNGKMTQENGERFKENAKTHANELEKAGLLKKESSTEFNFTDEKSRELLYDNHDKSIKEISKINKDDLKEFKKEVDVYKKTNDTKDLKRLQQDMQNKKDRTVEITNKSKEKEELFRK